MCAFEGLSAEQGVGQTSAGQTGAVQTGVVQTGAGRVNLLGSACRELSCFLWQRLCHLFYACNRLALSGVLCVAGGVLLGDVFGYDLRSQAFLAPLLLILVYYTPQHRTPQHRALRLPLLLLMFTLSLWAIGEIWSEARFFPGVFRFVADKEPRIILSHIHGNIAGEESGVVLAHRLGKRMELIHRVYQTPAIYRVAQGFSDDKASRWLHKAGSAAVFMLTGDSKKLRLIFNPNISLPVERTLDYGAAARLNSLVPWGLNENDVYRIAPNWAAEQFLLGGVPASLNVNFEPQEVTLHYLAWLGKAFAALSQDASSAERESIWRDALSEALQSGRWKSQSPVALVQYLLATVELLQSRDSPLNPQVLWTSSFRRFKKAAALVDQGQDGELLALIYNNAAVGLIVEDQERGTLRRAKRWLISALEQQNLNDDWCLGARLAAYNLALLEALEKTPS